MKKGNNKLQKLVFIFLCLGSFHIYSQTEKPNIIFLFADDQRADAIGASGNPYIKTPNIDNLAKEGFYFKNNYCAGSYSGAVCIASRAMLMTGMHWTKMKSKGGMNKFEFFPELLAQNGYRTYAIGKWHNKEESLKKAFQAGSSIMMGGMTNHTKVQLQDLSNNELVNERIQTNDFSSKIFADAAIDYINNPTSTDPFFLYVAFTAPHDPRDAPLPYREEYYKSPPPLPGNFMPLHPFDNGFLYSRDEGLAPWPRPMNMIQDQLSEYYALITLLDEQVGRIYEALKDSQYADNTYIVYTADHGLALGSHGLLGKQNVYEQSMKTPLIIYGPDVPKGKSSKAFTYILDMYATCLNVAGVKIPDEVDAKDLSQIWKGEKNKVRDVVFLPFQEKMRTVNDGRWKLHIYPPSNYVLLYDLKNDPEELINLANNPIYKDTISNLESILRKWQKKVNDNQPLFVENPISPDADYSRSKFSNKNRILDPFQSQWIIDKYFRGHEDSSVNEEE